MTAAAIICTSCGAAPARAAARYCDACGCPLTAPNSHAEFKQVTALFADVVGSMDIAAAVGPERLREIMAGLVGCGAAVVKRYGGTMDKFTGDGLMAVLVRQWPWRITRFAHVWRGWACTVRRNDWPKRCNAVTVSSYSCGWA